MGVITCSWRYLDAFKQKCWSLGWAAETLPNAAEYLRFRLRIKTFLETIFFLFGLLEKYHHFVSYRVNIDFIIMFSILQAMHTPLPFTEKGNRSRRGSRKPRSSSTLSSPRVVYCCSCRVWWPDAEVEVTVPELWFLIYVQCWTLISEFQVWLVWLWDSLCLLSIHPSSNVIIIVCDSWFYYLLYEMVLFWKCVMLCVRACVCNLLMWTFEWKSVCAICTVCVN